MNREAYDAISARWDDTRIRLSDGEQRLLNLLVHEMQAGARVLDLGCGTGRPVAEFFVAQHLAVTGVDQSPRMLELARRRLPGQRWIEASLEDHVPQPGYAAAVAWDSLFHVPRHHHASIFGRVRAALREGGRFALTVGGSAHPAFFDTMFGQTFYYDSHAPDETQALLRGAGFSIDHAEFLNLPTSGRDKGRFAIVAHAG
jgi:cyclopropane fatty-acyl-phospholipid synthase-like methyltransferase